MPRTCLDPVGSDGGEEALHLRFGERHGDPFKGSLVSTHSTLERHSPHMARPS